MTERELDSVKKNSILSQEFSTTTKTSIITNDLQKLSQTIKKCIAIKKSIMSQEFLPTTKTSIITNDLQKLSQTIRKCIAMKKSVTVLVLESDK